MDINDVRTIHEFKGCSFSEFKLSEVKSASINELERNNIVNSYYWFMELLCSGHINDIWELIIQYYGNKINVGNPKLVIYLDMIYNKYVNILSNGYTNYELAMRNNHEIRKLFCEMTMILCQSIRTPTLEKIKIIDTNDFDLDKIVNKLKAPNTGFVDNIFYSDDPYELYIPVNELAYSLSKENIQKNLWNSIYWIEWILQYGKQYYKNYDELLKISTRNINVHPSFKKDFIWIIWDVLLDKSLVDLEIQKKIINSVFNIFIINYKQGTKEKRKQLFFFACKVIVDYKSIDFKLPIVENNDDYNQDEIINIVFNEIKKNEKTPNTGYLNVNEDRSNVEKTVEKINALKSFMNY